MKATLMQITRSRMRRSSTLGHPETSEAEDGEDGEAVTVHVSGREVNPNPSRTLKGQLNKESVRLEMHKVPLRQRSLPPGQDCHTRIHHKLLIGTLIYGVAIATR